MRLNIGSRDRADFDRLPLYKSRHFVGNLYRKESKRSGITRDRNRSGLGFQDFKLSRLVVAAAAGTKDRMHLLRQRELRR